MEKKNNLKLKLDNRKFVITSEITPPKGTDYKSILDIVKDIKDKVDAINVTDQQSSIMSLNSIVMSYFLSKQGYEVICQFTCRDRNRIALQSDLLGASVLGINNILALTGDHPSAGDHPDAKPVFDLDAVQLLNIICKLEKGFDMNGNRLKGKPPLFLKGAAVNPGAHPLEPEIIRMEKKIKAGTQFFQTQAMYDMEKVNKFLKIVKEFNVPILIGIIPVKSISMAKYINKEIPGIRIPQQYIERLAKAKNLRKESVRLTVNFIKELMPLVNGVHIMPVGWPEVVSQILEEVGAGR